MSKTKLLVTGSCGFIFSNFVRHILHNDKKYDVVSIDKVAEPNSLHNIYANKGHMFYVGDIADAHIVNTIFEIEKPDIVVHGAAESKVDDSIANAQPFIMSNVVGTQVMVDASLRYGVKKFIYISTDEVYGQLENDSEDSWTEESELAPRNPYSAAKASGELIVKAASITHGLKYNITRSCNNFGPRQSTKNLIPKIIKCILNDEKVPIYGQGLQLREWIHVFDKCQAILSIIENGEENEVYNISAGWEFTNIEIFHEICTILGKGYNLVEFIEDPRPGHDFRYSVDATKLKGLGWAPKYKFKPALKQCVNWFANNQWVFK
jgi:dTDP-glucose 4,6-dehydratase